MRYDAKIADLLAFSFTIVILIFAASGPLNEFVRWFIETTTADFENFRAANNACCSNNIGWARSIAHLNAAFYCPRVLFWACR